MLRTRQTDPYIFYILGGVEINKQINLTQAYADGAQGQEAGMMAFLLWSSFVSTLMPDVSQLEPQFERAAV